jgi:hypothetical protein
MTKLMQLHPGDQVVIEGFKECTFIGRIDPHPLYPHLWMAIWRDNKTAEWYHDALNPMQDIGEVQEPRDKAALEKNLRWSLFGEVR